MTEYKKIFIDTAPFIYLLDGDPHYVSTAAGLFQDMLDTGKALFTSVITCEEYLIAPYRTGNLEKEQAFLSFLTDCGISILEIDLGTALKAAQIRAEYRGFKSMDALQLAAACAAGCDLFLTNDKQLLQFQEIPCVTLDSLKSTQSL